MPGQTLREIRQLLEAADLAPQHRFGQNFLIDLNLMRKLVEAAEVSERDSVLEVGPGTGSLTELLLDTGARVVAVEIDRGLQSILRERLTGHPHFTLIQGDALAGKHRINPLALRLLQQNAATPDGPFKLVANLPYQIATPLLMDLLQVSPPFERLTCTIQKEVGQRLTAEPSTPAYGPVSVICQTLADLTPIAILPPTVFWPRPKVESIMLTLRPRPASEVDVDDVPAFVSLVQRGFQQRRKKIRRLFREWEETAVLRVFHLAAISDDARPDQLAPSAWCRLARAMRMTPGP